MFRNIAILLEDKSISTNFINITINMAKASGSNITGVYVLPLNRTMLSMPEVVDVKSFRDKAQEIRQKFESSVKAADLNSNWNYSECRDIATEVARQGLYSDLIVVGLGVSELKTIDSVLLTASCPTLLIPQASISSGNFKRILVAWKNTRESARALHDSLPLLHQAEEVKVITFSDNKQEKESLNSYLSTHNIKAKIDQKIIDSNVIEYGQPMEIDKVIGDKIIELSMQEEFELIVMGCFGHSRLGDAVLSGVTNQISRNTQIPVLMSR